jgi:colicin import membrane protein
MVDNGLGADQAALDQHNKDVADAAARLEEYYARKEKERIEAEQVAADEALIKSPPPTPQLAPTVRPGNLSPAQMKKRQAIQEAADKEAAAKKTAADKKAAAEKKAADEKMARDKAEADRLANSEAKQTF